MSRLSKKTAATPVLGAEDNTNIHIGSRLRERRLALQMSQTDLGAAAGISFQQVQKYERGTNRISVSMLNIFAEALHAPVSFFLPDNAAGSMLASTTKTSPYQAGPTKEMQDLLALYETIDDPKLRKQVLEFAKTLSKAAMGKASAKTPKTRR